MRITGKGKEERYFRALRMLWQCVHLPTTNYVQIFIETVWRFWVFNFNFLREWLWMDFHRRLGIGCMYASAHLAAWESAVGDKCGCLFWGGVLELELGSNLLLFAFFGQYVQCSCMYAFIVDNRGHEIVITWRKKKNNFRHLFQTT